jgi:hypothetical protein
MIMNITNVPAIIFGIMIVAILFSMGSVSAYVFQDHVALHDSVRLTLNAQKSTASVLSLDVAAFEVNNVAAAEFDVDFDSTALEWAGATANDAAGFDKGTFFDSSSIYTIGNEIAASGAVNKNKLVVGVIGNPASPKSGSASIMTVKFKIIRNATTALSFSNNNLLKPDFTTTSSTWYGGTFVPDTAVPVRSAGSPSGALAAGTTQAVLSLTTNENANCRYSLTAGVSYAAMTNTFSTTGGTVHSNPVAGLVNGQAYAYYVKCIDTSGNANQDDFTITFSVAQGDQTAPLRSNGQPSGTLPAGTAQSVLSLSTNENANCRYSITPGVSYASMTFAFSTTGGSVHSNPVAGLVNGQTYSYYVKCSDTSGNANSDDYTISFSIALQGDVNAPVRSNGQPAGTLPAGTTQATLSLNTDENAACRYSNVAGTSYSSMTAFATTGGTAHSTVVSGLQNGNAYYYYVRCGDQAGNANTNDFPISFAVASISTGNQPPKVTAVTITPTNPAKSQTLFCYVTVTDQDGNLNNLVIKWYVNGVPVREINSLLTGTTNSIADTFDGNKNANDYIVCEAKVYDSNGAYDIKSNAVRVGIVVSNSIPQVSYVDITPRHPNPQQDLTCSVFATDTDDNLDHVNIQWFGNDRIIRSKDVRIQGSSDTAIDTLSASQLHEGEFVKCKAGVFDANGATDSKDSLTVIIGNVNTNTATFAPYQPTIYYPTYTPNTYQYYYGFNPVAMISATKTYVLSGEMVQFSGRGSYDPLQGVIEQYEFDFGDGSFSAWIPESTAYHSYNASGTYYARLKVKNDAGNESAWSNYVIIYVDYGYGYGGYSGGYYGYNHRPSIDDVSLVKNPSSNYINFECKVEAFDQDSDLEYVRFKWYFNGELLSTERADLTGRNDEQSDSISVIATPDDTIKCEVIVYDSQHNFVSQATDTSGSSEGAGCGLNVDRFDYVTYTFDNQNTWVEAEATNIGASGTLSMKLFVDGAQKETYSIHLAFEENAIKRFEFPLSAGTHQIRLEIRMPKCTAPIVKTTEITVFPSSSEGVVPVTPGPTPPPAPAAKTSVRIYPTALDAEMNKGNTISVFLESTAKAKFTISVLGLQDGWANYQSEVEVDGSKTSYIYIVPKNTGNYNFTVKVTTTNKTVEQAISMFVAPGPSAGSGLGGIGTGLVSALGSHWLIGLVILVILAVLIVMYFLAGSVKGKSYEDKLYGDRKPPYYGPYRSGTPQPRYPVNRPPQPAQKIARPIPRQPDDFHAGGGHWWHSGLNWRDGGVNWHPGGGHWHLGKGRWFPGRYSDGTGFPKYGDDFLRK